MPIDRRVSLSFVACLRLITTLVCTFTLLVPLHHAAAAPTAGKGEAGNDEAGDLSADVEAATEARKADPSAEHWRAEAQARERLGDFVGAQEAYRGELGTLPEDAIDARRRSEADWERMREQARGKVADEPASTHRAEFDRRWAPPVPAEQLKPAPRPKADPVIDEPKDERIVTKWYFWVTVAAIAASAGAVTGIAIKAARDERSDALDASALGPARMLGPTSIRF